MKSQQDIRNLDYFLESLDPALLEKLAANILDLTSEDLQEIQSINERLFTRGEAENGL